MFVYCRVQISISIYGAINDGMQTQSLFPMYMLLARVVPTTNVKVLLSTFTFGQNLLFLSFMSYIMPNEQFFSRHGVQLFIASVEHVN